MAHNKETPKLSEDSANLLLQELDSLHSAIIELSCTEAYANDGTNLMAIVRLLPGATRQEWLEISEKYNLGQWLAIDLKKNTTRNLLELYEQMQQLAFQKDHDPLTGLPNRRMFMRTFQVELERQERQRSSLSLVSLDLDHFKKINDSWGHAIGDIVLKGLADALSKSKRPYDTAAPGRGGICPASAGRIRSAGQGHHPAYSEYFSHHPLLFARRHGIFRDFFSRHRVN